MKRAVLLASLMLVPVALFIGSWQSYAHYRLRLEVETLEKRQQALLDENRRLVAEHAFATSPGTIEKRAVRELGMMWPAQDQVISLKVGTGGGE